MRLVLDVEKCIGCRSCTLACSAKHQGVFNPRKAHLRVIDYYSEQGRKIELKTCKLFSCLKCVEACPVDAIGSNGKWLVINKETCTSCGACVDACPEGVVFFGRDGVAAVPDFCGGKPYCVEWCPHEAIRLEEAGS